MAVLLLGTTSACRPDEAKLPPALAARILVETEGPTQIDANMLEDADLNWDLRSGQDFQLFSDGRPQALQVVDDPKAGGFRLGFYAESPLGLESGQRAYLLTKGEAPGWLMAGVDAPAERLPYNSTPEAAANQDEDTRSSSLPLPSAGSNLVLASQRLEVDTRYLPQRLDGSPWLWEMVSAPGEVSIPIDLAGLADGPARLRLGLWAATRSPQPIDHRLVVSIGEQTVDEVEWDGDGSLDLSFDLPRGLLRETDTQISLSLPGIEGIAADVVHLDWLAVDYPREADLPNQQSLSFVATGGTRFSAESGSLTLFDESGVLLAENLLPEDGRVALDDLERGRRYTLAGPDAWLRPALVQRAGDGLDLRAEDRGAQWLAIGPADLLEPLAPLAELREAEGLRSLQVDAEWVYDQFGHGQSDVVAIQNFLRYADKHWSPAPQYVLLVGDASTDPRGLLDRAGSGDLSDGASGPEHRGSGRSDAHRLPTLYVQTQFGGMTASDPLIGQLDDDPWPDLALGRIPARSSEQVEVFVEKVLSDSRASASGELDSDSSTSWRRQALALADGREGIFKQDAQRFLDRLPEGYTQDLLAPETSDEDIADALVERLDAGAGLVAYFGHGTVSQWGQDRLFTREDVPRLRNGERLPIVLHMTCLAGLFTHPEAESLSEALLFHPEGGALAMLAPTSLTLGTDQSFLSNAFADALAEPDLLRLGDAVLRAWEAVPMDRASSRDVVQTFVILGDPAQALAPLR